MHKKDVLGMKDFPEFMKSKKNRINSTEQNTEDVDGYFYEGADGKETVLNPGDELFYDVTKQAVSDDRNGRQQSIEQLMSEWHKAKVVSI